MNFENNREQIRLFIKENSFRENHQTPFTLASGKKSPYYFDLKQTLLYPPMLKLASLCLIDLIKNKSISVKALGGLTMGSDPLIYACCLSGIEQNIAFLPLIVRKEAKDHGSAKQIEGLLQHIEFREGIALIDDVITTGMSTLKAYNALHEAGYSNIKHAICILDRNEGGREALLQQGIQLHSLFNIDDFKTK